MSTFSNLRPSKIYSNRDFWFEKKPSDNPVFSRKGQIQNKNFKRNFFPSKILSANVSWFAQQLFSPRFFCPDVGFEWFQRKKGLDHHPWFEWEKSRPGVAQPPAENRSNPTNAIIYAGLPVGIF
jgi:hypothetical protein